MAVTVEHVVTKKQTREFMKFPYALYKNDKNWVPAAPHGRLQEAQPEEASLLPARGGRVLPGPQGRRRWSGRIAAIHDTIWEKTHHEKAAYWGWFECVDDPEVAKALFDAAFDWARKRGCVRIIGPMSPNANDLIGCQIEGFEGSPVILMPYNPTYYDKPHPGLRKPQVEGPRCLADGQPRDPRASGQDHAAGGGEGRDSSSAR